LAKSDARLKKQVWKSCIVEPKQKLLRLRSTAISDTDITSGHKDAINKLCLTLLDRIHEHRTHFK